MAAVSKEAFFKKTPWEPFANDEYTYNIKCVHKQYKIKVCVHCGFKVTEIITEEEKNKLKFLNI